MHAAIERFIEHLNGYAKRDDRAALARLRRGLGKPPGQAVEMMPLVVPYLPPADWGQQDAYFLVATLFAMHPKHRAEAGFGLALRNVSDNDSAEKRFMVLLNAHPDELDTHLRQCIGLLKTRDIGLDYAQLLDDILHWDHPDRYVQRRWAGDYWGKRQNENDESLSDNNTEEEE